MAWLGNAFSNSPALVPRPTHRSANVNLLANRFQLQEEPGRASGVSPK
jgi:hypothetical protein